MTLGIGCGNNTNVTSFTTTVPENKIRHPDAVVKLIVDLWFYGIWGFTYYSITVYSAHILCVVKEYGEG